MSIDNLFGVALKSVVQSLAREYWGDNGPRAPRLVYVCSLGHSYGWGSSPNTMRCGCCDEEFPVMPAFSSERVRAFYEFHPWTGTWEAHVCAAPCRVVKEQP